VRPGGNQRNRPLLRSENSNHAHHSCVPDELRYDKTSCYKKIGFLYYVGDGSYSLVDAEVKGADSWRSLLRRVFEIVVLSYEVDDTDNKTLAAMLLGRKELL
jgi:hypothetical protein